MCGVILVSIYIVEREYKTHPKGLVFPTTQFQHDLQVFRRPLAMHDHSRSGFVRGCCWRNGFCDAIAPGHRRPWGVSAPCEGLAIALVAAWG